MSSNPKPGAVLYAKDVELVRAFYQDVLGLEAVDVKSDHVVLETPAFQLVILKIPKALASSVNVENPPRRRTDTPIKLVFPIPSISEARVRAISRGGEFNPPEREWDFQGCRVCDGLDPEGNVVQVRANAL
jgi:predicted enzyme related to lactoylglutathione lyase